MNVLKYRVSLDMFDTLSQTTIKAKKGDSACQIHITLTEHGKVYHIGEGCYATFNAKKSDGNFIYDKCTIENNTIVYDFSSSIDENGSCQVSACEGNVECEVTLYKANGEKLTSPRFILYIDGTVYNGEEIISSPESDVLKGLIIEARNTVDEVETKLENGDFKGEKGDKGDKGEQGEKGDKGEPGVITNLDQTYNPDSQNAQSGVAVKEAIDLTAPRIKVVTSQAKSHTLTDTADRNMLGIKIIGNASQEGTPLPDAPLPIQCVKQGTKIVIKNGDTTDCEITLPCDLYDGDIWYPLTGVVERYSRILTLNNSMTNIYNYDIAGTQGIGINSILEAPQMRVAGYCTHSTVDVTSVGVNPRVWYGVNSRHFYWVGVLDYLGLSSVEEFKEWLVGKDVTFIYKEVTPIIEQYEPISNSLLKTFKPVTNLLNDNVTELEANIEVEYIADTKNYIDNKLSKIIMLMS